MRKLMLIMCLLMLSILPACGVTTTQETPIQQIIPTSTVDINSPYPIQQMEAYPSPLIDESSAASPIIGDIPNPLQDTPDPNKSPVIISNINHNENGIETISITNISEQSQDINGYSLINPMTSEHINIFNVVLEPGDSFFVYNGLDATEYPDGLAWMEQPIIQHPGDSIYLLNHAGRLIWSYVYYP